jgi:hypothetical protein
VFIEPRAADFFLVHDGGKAVNELILQGMRITPAIERGLTLMASRFGVSYDDEMFQTGTKIVGIAEKAYAVAMCSALAMTNILEHVPMVEEEPLEGQIGTVLRQWGKNRAKITTNVRVPGKLKQHMFDFLVSPKGKGKPISVSVLHPTAGSLAAAERFYFKANDLAKTQIRTWPMVAVEAKAENWSPDARKIVKDSASAVVPIKSGDPVDYDEIASILDEVA